jgi:hypothetical protein
MIRDRSLRAREKLVSKLPVTGEWLRGSLLERTVRHTKDCPKCARGEGHRVFIRPTDLPSMRQNLDSGGAVTATCSVPQETPDCFLLDLRSQTGALVADTLRSGWYAQCVLHHLAKRQEVDLARRRPPPRQPDTAAGLRFDKTQ